MQCAEPSAGRARSHEWSNSHGQRTTKLPPYRADESLDCTRRRLVQAAKTLGLPRREELVLIAAIGKNWNRVRNDFFASVCSLGRQAGYSERNARRALSAMAGRGVITRSMRVTRRGQGSNFYRLGDVLFLAAGMPDPSPDRADNLAGPGRTTWPGNRDLSDLVSNEPKEGGEGTPPPDDQKIFGRRITEFYAELWQAKYKRQATARMRGENLSVIAADLRKATDEALAWARDRGASPTEAEVFEALGRGMITRWLEEAGSPTVFAEGYLIAKQHPLGAIHGDHSRMIEAAVKRWKRASGLRKAEPLPTPEPEPPGAPPPPEAWAMARGDFGTAAGDEQRERQSPALARRERGRRHNGAHQTADPDQLLRVPPSAEAMAFAGADSGAEAPAPLAGAPVEGHGRAAVAAADDGGDVAPRPAMALPSSDQEMGAEDEAEAWPAFITAEADDPDEMAAALAELRALHAEAAGRLRQELLEPEPDQGGRSRDGADSTLEDIDRSSREVRGRVPDGGNSPGLRLRPSGTSSGHGGSGQPGRAMSDGGAPPTGRARARTRSRFARMREQDLEYAVHQRARGSGR